MIFSLVMGGCFLRRTRSYYKNPAHLDRGSEYNLSVSKEAVLQALDPSRNIIYREQNKQPHHWDYLTTHHLDYLTTSHTSFGLFDHTSFGLFDHTSFGLFDHPAFGLFNHPAFGLYYWCIYKLGIIQQNESVYFIKRRSKTMDRGW